MTTDPDLQELNSRLDRKVQQLEAFIEFGRVLAGSNEPEVVARRLALTLAGQLALRACAVVAFRDGRPPLIHQRGMRDVASIDFALRREITNWRTPFPLPKPADGELILAILERAGTLAVVPLVSGETTIGFAALGPRASAQPLTDDDLLHASGLAAQAVVAIESAWQFEEASHWRLLTEVGNEWRELDRFSRLVFVAIARLGYEQQQTDTEFVSAFMQAMTKPGFELQPDRVASTVERLIARGAIVRDDKGVLRIAKEQWLALPDARKPLEEIARESFERIGAYEVQQRIGRGGMGEVFRAINVHDGSVAALKLLAPTMSENPDTRLRLEREGAIVASISHPNVVRLIERGEHEGRMYLAMELVEGEPLSSYIQKAGALTPAAAVRYALDLASALAELHARGVIHRDLKPWNIMRTPEGRLVLLDFGLARGLESTTVTRHSEVMGTLPYMSPEQVRGEKLDARADVWSFGIVFYQLLTGARPWLASDTVPLAVEILSTQVSTDPIRDIAGDEVASLIGDTLAPLARRIPSGTVLRERLNALTNLSQQSIPGSQGQSGEDLATERLIRPIPWSDE